MNPFIFDPKTSATFVPPRTIEEQLEWARKVDAWVRQRDAAHKAAQGKESIMGDIDTPNAELGDLNLPTL
jgi:hypothetical protein